MTHIIDIRTAQNNINQSEQEIEIATKQIQEIIALFSKSPYLQIQFRSFWDKSIELSFAMCDKDYSKLLFKLIAEQHEEFKKTETSLRKIANL